MRSSAKPPKGSRRTIDAPAPRRERGIDLLGGVAFAAYLVIGGAFVFGFGRSLGGAVQTQNETPCRSQVPMQARIVGTVLDPQGNPIPDAELVPVIDGRAGRPFAVGTDGHFVTFLPRRSHSLIARAPGRAQIEGSLVLGDAQSVEVAFVLAPEGGPSTFAEKARGTFEAPDFVAKDLQGKEIRLSDFRGKLVVLNFWATWCEPCITEWPQLSQLAERLSDRDDVVVLAVSVEEDPRSIPPFLQQMSLQDSRVVVAWDPTARVHHEFGSTNIPDTYFVDEQGRVTDVFINVREWGSPDAFHCVESSVAH